MAGHSKWANIQHRKGRQDAKRGKIFTRLIKEITVAAKMGGGDPNMNPRLRLAVDKAYENNMPKDNVERAIKRGSGDLDGVNYEEIRYEGYGLNGAALIVDCLTDNRVRTVAEVRHAFTKFGGNMGASNSVAFLFKHCGQLLFAPGTNEEKLMEAALEAGAEDVVSSEDGSIEVLTDPHEFTRIKAALEKAGFKAELAEVTMKASTETELAGEDGVKMQKLLDAIEALDDVQEVYTNAVIAGLVAELLEALLLDIPEVLETDRLTLRAVDAGHGAASHAAMAESFAELHPWMPWAKQMQTPEQSEGNARETRAKWLAREALDFSWFRRADGVLVARGGLHTIDWAVPKFEIGYWVRTSCARQGYATEGTLALARFARESLGARRLEIGSDASNLASRRVAEKCGFALEGILKQARRNNAGELADACVYAKTF